MSQNTPQPWVEIRGREFGVGSLFAICGPCVIESRDLALAVAERLAEISDRLDMPILFKSSFDKANRTSIESFRGPGMDDGLRVLDDVRAASGLGIISDIHQPHQAAPAADVLDVLQIPAFLCRQTDLLVAAGMTGKPINVKKGQFLAPGDMTRVVAKVLSTGNQAIWLTERGTFLGYGNLVVDMRSLGLMAHTGCPVVFDATHSVQLPGGQGASSGGDRRFVAPLARAAVAAGAHGVFLEVHPDPDNALCDGPNSLALDDLEPLLTNLRQIYQSIPREPA